MIYVIVHNVYRSKAITPEIFVKLELMQYTLTKPLIINLLFNPFGRLILCSINKFKKSEFM